MNAGHRAERELMRISVTSTGIAAVSFTSRGAVVAGRNNLVVVNNNSAILSMQTSGTSCDGFCDIQVVVIFINSRGHT